MSLEKEMLAVILKDLPNQTSGVLKSYLDEAEKTKKELNNLKTELEYKIKEVAENRKLFDKQFDLNKELLGKLKSQQDIDDQQHYLEKQNRDINLILANKEIASLQRENAAIMELNRIIFKNPTIKETVTKQTHILHPEYIDPNNSYNNQKPFVDTRTTIDTTSKEIE